MRYLILIMLFAALALAGCQRDSADEPAEETVGTAQLEDDMTEVYDEAMEQAEEAEAGIAELLERDPAEGRESAVERVWERAAELARDAREASESAIETARGEGGEAWEEARDAAERARERSRMAWEEASAFTGEAWQDVREATREIYEEAEESWARLREVEVEEAEDDGDR